MVFTTCDSFMYIVKIKANFYIIVFIYSKNSFIVESLSTSQKGNKVTITRVKSRIWFLSFYLLVNVAALIKAYHQTLLFSKRGQQKHISDNSEREREKEWVWVGREQWWSIGELVLITSELHHLLGLPLFGNGVDDDAVASVDVTLSSRDEGVVDQLTRQILQVWRGKQLYKVLL